MAPAFYLVISQGAAERSRVEAVERSIVQARKDIRALVLVAAPEGVKALNAAHPDVRCWTAAIDSHLNDHGYIVPGLGDAGDRMYGTK